MSVRDGLLVLLADGPAHGARLQAAFERRTGGTWPLNIGQVYTTLGRLQRDGLVLDVTTDDDVPRRRYALTPAGHDAVDAWWSQASTSTPDPRDELTIKLALAVDAEVDVAALVQRHRAAGLARLQDLNRRKRGGLPDLAAELVMERRIFDTEALVRWLDHVEERLTPKDER